MSFIREPDAEPIVGYRLIEPLGNGGFGEVWKCEAPGGIYKAIKFVYGNLNSLDSDRAPAEQELNALNAVKEVRHPFVLSMDRIEVVEGELCIVMELADKNLQDCMDECQAAGLVGIPRDDLLRYLRDAAEALDHMIQKHNLQHLDIKPRNLFLISDRVKVADFGLVKHLERQSGSLSSVTPIYAPPETFAGKISEHSDQYSLAIVYQEMLTGQRPFNGKNARQLMMQHTSQDPELRSLPEPERPIIARALAKDPTKRFPNCLSFIRALYNARPKVEALLDEKKVGKSMSETMEDISLEQMEGDVDLAGTPTHGEEEGPVSELGLTLIQPQTGALRPTLIIGMGGFARRCILELRTRMIDRFGDLNKVPLFRFLYIDPDAEACQTLLRGKEDMACTSEEVYHMALQPISNYRRRMMEHVSDWLPHEKLYTLPRSLQTQGVRALGRLAFVDHHLRLLGKVRRAVQHISHPDSLYQAVSQTGLALRDRKPRVYVIMAAGGGSSGTIVDLGYALRRLLQQLKMPNAEVTAVVFCGAPDDPATPKPEQANVYATLTELSHFSDPTIPFTAQYGADGPRIVHEGPPFSYIYLMKLGHRSPEALRDAVAHLGSYLYHELATPLGVKLENSRKPRPAKADITPFRSFGTYQVWFPRGLMLRLAGRQACLTLLRDWQSTEESTAQAEIEAACARAVADPELRYETICGHIEELAAAGFETNLASALTSFLSSLEEQSMQAIAQDDPGNWARQAALRVQEWVGTSMGLTRDSDLQKSKLNRALMGAVNKLADKWSHKLTKVAYGLMEIPGRRIVTSESAIQRLIQFCNDQTALHRERLDQQVQRSRTAESHLEKALDSCMSGGGGFSFFGNRNKRLLRVFMDHLAAYSRQCLAESLVGAGLQFYTILRGRLEDRLRELTFCRQRLRHMQEKLIESKEAAALDPVKALEDDPTPELGTTETYWELIRATETARLVLPDAETDLEKAAQTFLRSITAEQWIGLDQALQDQVFTSLGGLAKICLTTNDLHRSLSTPILLQLATALGDLLPITDVAQVEFSAEEVGRGELVKNIQRYHRRAAPLLTDKDPSNENAFLLIPASEAGRAFGEAAKQAVPEFELVRVPGQADLMICREQGYLSNDALRHTLRPCRQAHEEAAYAPASSPFCRFDITDWMPLE